MYRPVVRFHFSDLAVKIPIRPPPDRAVVIGPDDGTSTKTEERMGGTRSWLSILLQDATALGIPHLDMAIGRRGDQVAAVRCECRLIDFAPGFTTMRLILSRGPSSITV